MTTQAHIYLLWGVGFFEVILAFYLLFRYQKSESITSLAGMFFGFSLMAFFVGLLLTNLPLETRLFIAKGAFSAGAISFIMMFRLSLWYPSPTNISRKISDGLTTALLIVLPLYIFLVPGFLKGVVIKGTSIAVTTGSPYIVFVFLTTVIFIATLIFLIRKINTTAVPVKQHLLWLIVIVGITGTLGIITNNIFPMLGKSSGVTGPEGTGIIALLVAAIVLKK